MHCSDSNYRSWRALVNLSKLRLRTCDLTLLRPKVSRLVVHHRLAQLRLRVHYKRTTRCDWLVNWSPGEDQYIAARAVRRSDDEAPSFMRHERNALRPNLAAADRCVARPHENDRRVALGERKRNRW